MLKQRFTLHTHNNELHFDGRYSAREMIQAAQDKGFETIGVSNHMIAHKNLTPYLQYEPMFFDDYNKAEQAYLKHIEILNNLKTEFKINIKIGFEVDFFTASHWQKFFEKMIPHLPVDYLINGNHFLKSEDESFMCNIFHLKHLNPAPDKETIHQWLVEYYKNTIRAIKSGYFSFIAHFDYPTRLGLSEEPIYDEYKYKVLEALKETKTPFELNTNGYEQLNHPYPHPKFIKEMSKNGGVVPIVLSDDAHFTERLGQHFNEAEQLLKELNYTNRFTLDMLRKPI